MKAGDLGHRLERWPEAAAAAIAPTLDDAAETVVAEARQRLGTMDVEGTSPDDAVVAGRDEQGRATLTVTAPAAAALEFGTRRTPARPFVRPALLALRDDLRRRVADAVRRALTSDNAR